MPTRLVLTFDRRVMLSKLPESSEIDSLLILESRDGAKVFFLADGAMARACIVKRRGSQISALIGHSCNSNCVPGSPVRFERVGALVS